MDLGVVFDKMDVSFVCPDCQSKLKFDAASYPPGTEIDCPNCSSNITIPRPNIGPGVTIGGFELKKMLGKGGMGEVYLATQRSMDRDVALKILPGQFAFQDGAVERFLQEVKMAARLKHPNIVRAYEAGEDHGVYFLAMDFVEGTSIDDRLRGDGAIPETEVRVIAEKLGRALDQIWEKHKMIHRDIKPANIMLDEYGEPLLMDMGLSKALDDGPGMTVSSAIMGSPNYMSPEQAEGAADLDFRTDMYSLGATFYHMLTGKVPFKGKSVMEVLRKQATEQLRDPREHNPDISDGMVRIIERMMAKKAEHRYSTWHDFLKAIESLVFGKASEEPELNPGESVIMRASDAREPISPQEVEEWPGEEEEDSYEEVDQNDLNLEYETSSGETDPPSSRKALFIGIGAAVALLVAIGAFVASRPSGNERNKNSPLPALTDDGTDSSPTTRLTSPAWVWSDPVHLKAVSSPHGDTHPFLSDDGLTLIFASDRPGGAGALDLWQSTRDSVEEMFPAPVPLPGEVNTSHKETGPWMSEGGLSLLFTTDRPGGKGDGDIWRSTRPTPTAKWGPPSFFGGPNTPRQELGPAMSPDGKELLVEQWSDYQHFQIRLARRDHMSEPFSYLIDPGTGINSVGREGGPEFLSDGQSFLFQSGPANGKDDIWLATRIRAEGLFERRHKFGTPLNTTATDAHPTISADGRILVFSSDRPGGLGKLDLWMSHLVPKSNRTTSNNADVDLQQGLIGHWNFEDPSQNRAVDSSGNGHSGATRGSSIHPMKTEDAPPVSWAGKSSLIFRRQSQRVDVSVDGDLGISNALTMAGWVKRGNDADRFRNVISRHENFGIRLTVRGMVVLGSEGKRFKEFKPKGSTQFPLNRWYHVAGVFDGKFVYLYLDGQLSQRLPHSISVPVLTGPLALGRMGGAQIRAEMETLIDDVRLYNRALSADEIKSLAGR